MKTPGTYRKLFQLALKSTAIFMFAVLGFAPAARASIAVGPTKSSGLNSGGWTGGSATLTWNDFTIPAGGVSGKLLVMVAGENSATSFNITWAGTSLTLQRGTKLGNASAFVYALDNPADGTGPLIVIPTPAGGSRYGVTAIYATGVADLEASDAQSGDVAVLTAGPITPAAGSLVVSVGGHTANPFPNPPPTPNTGPGMTGATLLMNLTGSGSGGAVDYLIAPDSTPLSATYYQGTTGQQEAVVIASFQEQGPARITAFGIPGSSGTINHQAKTISLTVPWNPWGISGLAALAPTFTLSSGFCDQTSGSVPSPIWNGSKQATYTVTDGATVNAYTVTVSVTPASTACDILTFGPGAAINQGAQTIVWTVGVGTDPATLTPTYTPSQFATGVPASSGNPGFSGSPPTASYTITAQDLVTTKTYIVTVAFSPMPVWGGLACWYDASDGADPSGGGAITSWNDQSGNGHTATVGGGSPVLAVNQLNGKSAAQFRGNYLNCAGTMFTKEQYLVVRSPRTIGWGGYGAFLGRASGRGSSYLLTPENTTMWNDQAAQAVSRNGTPVVKNQHANGNYIFDLAPINEYMLLKIIVNDNNTSAASYQIARADGMSCDMDIAEILGYSSTLSIEDEAKVGAYLAYKYAINTAYPLINVPPAPTALTAEPLLNSVRLTWTAAYSASDYNVYRRTASGTYGAAIGTTGGATTYTDTDVTLVAGTTYYYVVKAVNSVGEGAASNEASAAPTSGNVDQTITFGPLAQKTYGDPPFELTATASSLLPVSYASSDPLVASVLGSTVTILKAGTTTITASQAGGPGFNPATPVDQLLTVVKANQTITFLLPLRLVRGTTTAPFDDSATGGASGNPVTYSSTVPGVATVDSIGVVTIVGVGTTEILADQLGDADHYSAAPQVSQTLIVIPPLLPVVSGLAVWYDAAQGVTDDGFGGVATWDDSSTLGHLATRASGSVTLVPSDVNGRPAVHLRGGGTWLDCAGGMFTKEQYLVVRSPNATWNGSGSFLGRASSEFLSVRVSSYNMAANTDGFWQDHFPSAVSKNGTPLAPNNVGGSAFHLAPMTDYMLLKITVDASASAANLAQYPYYQIGKNETLGTMDFDVAEIIGYESALSTEDEAKVGSYLAHKYGLITAYPDIAVDFTASISMSVSGDVNITFDTETGYCFRVEFTDSLPAGIWGQVPGSVAGDGTPKTLQDPAPGSPQRFYRVKKVSPCP